MPRYPIREARGLLDKVLVAAPGSAGGWRPTWSACQSSQGPGRRARAGSRRGTAAQASRTQERWLDLVAGRRTC
jgi:hypothetical protein